MVSTDHVTAMSDYEAVVTHLNSLQSSPQSIREARAKRPTNRTHDQRSGPKNRARNILQHLNLWDGIDRTQVVLITGTKGKGSTVAICDIILRAYSEFNCFPDRRDLTWGSFISPHIREVRERIRINGTSISRAEFAKYYNMVKDGLGIEFKHELKYFLMTYLTAWMAFRERRVDIAFFEAGVGGEYDVTNCLEAGVMAAGITRVQLDHVQTLGPTLEAIAWHKAGIFRSACPALTSPQEAVVEDVLRGRAKEKGALYKVVLADDETRLDKDLPPFQHQNAALAFALVDQVVRPESLIEPARAWSTIRHGIEAGPLPGRHKIHTESAHLTWYLDGAHTHESIVVTVRWWLDLSADGKDRILVFNQESPTRDAIALLEAIHSVRKTCTDIWTVMFTTNMLHQYVPDLNNNNVDEARVLQLELQQSLQQRWTTGWGNHKDTIHIISHVEDVVDKVRTAACKRPSCCLVTGSIHLVGAIFHVLDL